jgi:hypothetical protein
MPMARARSRYLVPLGGFLAGALLGPIVTWSALTGGDAIAIVPLFAGLAASAGVAYGVTALPAIFGPPAEGDGTGRRLLALAFLPVSLGVGAFAGMSLGFGLAQALPPPARLLIPSLIASLLGVLVGGRA